jgi:hypothetical protein
MTTEPKDNAHVYVGQIRTEHKAVLRADGDALKHALECGRLLNLAKENVESITKPKRKWSTWREEHCPEISQETSSVYMRLAKALTGDPKVFDDATSIRDALTKIPKGTRRQSGDGDSETSENENSSSATNSATHGSPDLKELMENCGADEISTALQDADKFDEVTTASIAKLSPEKVCDALTAAWTADQLGDLRTRLGAHLAKLKPTSQDTPNTTGAFVRRTLEMPRLS